MWILAIVFWLLTLSEHKGHVMIGGVPVPGATITFSKGDQKLVTITDAMVLELDDAGLIVRIRPHLRPWLAITLFALLLGPKIARHPGVVRRALRR